MRVTKVWIPMHAVLEYEKLKNEVEHAKGRVSAELKEQGVEAFKREFGKLETFIIPKIPGWTYKAKFLENSQQTQVIYFDPDMNQYFTAKQVEAVFGLRMLKGEKLDFIEKARDEFIKEHGSLDPGYNPLRRTSDGFTVQDAFKIGDMEKVTEVADVVPVGAPRQCGMKKQRIEYDLTPSIGDYEERADFAIVSATSNQELATLSVPRAVSIAEECHEIKESLLDRSFPLSTRLLVICNKEAVPHRFMDKISGIYFELKELYHGHPCFRWVCNDRRNASKSKTNAGLACLGLYIFWSCDLNRWEIRKFDGNEPRCFAFSYGDGPNLAEVERPWMVLRNNFGLPSSADN